MELLLAAGVVVVWLATLVFVGKRKYPSDVVEVWRADPSPLGSGDWYWHRKASNNEIISNGEGYESKQGAVKGAFRANPDIKRLMVQNVEVKKRRKQ